MRNLSLLVVALVGLYMLALLVLALIPGRRAPTHRMTA